MSVKKPIKDLKDNYYLSVKRVFLEWIKYFQQTTHFLIFAGSLFHKLGAATLNAQSPYDLNQDTGTCNSI